MENDMMLNNEQLDSVIKQLKKWRNEAKGFAKIALEDGSVIKIVSDNMNRQLRAQSACKIGQDDTQIAFVHSDSLHVLADRLTEAFAYSVNPVFHVV